MYVFGGNTLAPGNPSPYSDFFAYSFGMQSLLHLISPHTSNFCTIVQHDSDKSKWKHMKMEGYPQRSFHGAVLYRNRLLSFGGRTSLNVNHNDLYTFTFSIFFLSHVTYFMIYLNEFSCRYGLRATILYAGSGFHQPNQQPSLLRCHICLRGCR